MARQKTKGLLISVAFFIMTICIFGPLEMYITNTSELWFSLTDTLVIAGIMSVCSVVLLGGIGLLLKGKARNFYAALLFAVTLCLYIQGNYLNINYGVLDGKEINWRDYDKYALADTTFWAAVVVGLMIVWKKKNKLFAKIQRYGSAFVMAMQALTLVILLATSGVLAPAEDGNHYLSSENLYSVGEKDNIVIFVLDAFDEAYLEQIFDEEPEKYQEIFEDFTMYTNTAAGGATTYSAMPIILTGEHYPGEVSYKEYVKNAFNSDGLYTELLKNGYSVNVYTFDDFVPYDSGEYIDNLVNGEYVVSSHIGLAQKYGSLTLYRYMPHVLKQFFWLYTGEFDAFRGTNENGYPAYVQDDVQFYNELSTNGLQIKEGKTFTLIHTTGSHPPYTMNALAQYEENVSILEKSKGSLYIVEEYMRQMKELGVYDSSTIFIMSDHGQEILPRGIMMIKESGGTGFEKNDAPISHFDLHATLFEILGKETGESIFDIEEGAQRSRMYYPQSSKNGTFFMTEYEINGNPRDVGNGRATGVVLSPSKLEVKYQYGTDLTFGSDGTVNNYVESGLNTLHVDYAWTDGNETVFKFPLDKVPDKDLELVLTYYTVYLKINDQYLGIYVDDVLLFSEVLTSEASRTIMVDIPAELASDGEIVVKLDMPDAKCPAEVFGPGNDPHTLGLALTNLRISEIDLSSLPEYKFGTELVFGQEANITPYIKNGVSVNPEASFAWTSGHEVLFRVPLEKLPDSDMNITIGVANIMSDFGSQQVRVVVNDTECYGDTLSEVKDIKVTVAKDLIDDKEIAIRMYLPNAVSPYAETGEGDRRTLAVALKSLLIEEAE